MKQIKFYKIVKIILKFQKIKFPFFKKIFKI